MNIKPTGARVIIEVAKKEEVTAGGIIIPEKAQEETYMGTVVAVGPGMRLDNGTHFPMECKVGDKILYTRFAGVPFEHDGKEYMVINEAHILAIFPKEE